TKHQGRHQCFAGARKLVLVRSESKFFPTLSFPLNKPVANRIATDWQLARLQQSKQCFFPQRRKGAKLILEFPCAFVPLREKFCLTPTCRLLSLLSPHSSLSCPRSSGAYLPISISPTT